AWGVLAGPAEAGSAKDDLYQTVLARRALQNDALLAPLNLGVRVRQRVATLWGPVASAEAARRAVALLRELPELAAVRSEPLRAWRLRRPWKNSSTVSSEARSASAGCASRSRAVRSSSAAPSPPGRTCTPSRGRSPNSPG